MSRTIKAKIWELLSGKEVSLALIFNREGKILWSMGRKIAGENVKAGVGFSRTFIIKTLEKPAFLHRENLVVDSLDEAVSRSAFELHIGSLLIQPLEGGIFLYVDSGTKSSFTESDIEIFKILGALLGEMISHIHRGEEQTGIVGESPAIRRIKDLILKYSLEEEPVLIIGETGSGKSRIAEMIHHCSERKGAFVIVNTPCIPQHLFESELFGYKKGAFTDARADKKGLIDEAEGGTLFFDEISEVPYTFQAKLLRLIDTRKYSVLGETREHDAEIRFIAATNRNLGQAIREKEFREDLYFRLHTLELTIPPLRERVVDIPALVKEREELLKGKMPGEGFFEELMRHHWPGNVRELISVLTRAGIHCSNPINGNEVRDIIRQSQIGDDMRECDPVSTLWMKFQEGGNFWNTLWDPFIARDVDRKTIKGVLEKAFSESRGNFRKMISLLGLPESDYYTFMSLMYKYRIDPRK